MNPDAGPADLTALALRAAAGDVDALDRFVRATHDQVRRFIAYQAHPRHADDLTQETFARAIAALPTFQGRSHARTWLFSIAKNVVTDSQRVAARRRTVPHPAPDRLGPARSDVTTTVLDHLLAGLPAEQRDALVLTRVLGFGYDEAAEVLGCATGTIRSRVARARTALRAERRGRSAG
ncbi:sigma-70 family RNA polymerase sigma factor [Tsukamurella soli]|uniref:sigma-70 family RNA polymerase sigma factor n=1 Tax=Tsukamurella soli TaxID=644556 RepID=UPI0031F0A96B